jgi:hypothetical protein
MVTQMAAQPKPTNPAVLITFIDGFPTFDFQNWKPGISAGTIERAGLLLGREAMRATAVMIRQLKHEAETGTLDKEL